MHPMSHDIWILVHHREGIIEEVTFGLIGEACRLLSDLGGNGRVTAVALGSGLEPELKILGAYGAQKILYIESDSLRHYHGELFAEVLSNLAKRCAPSCILMAHTAEASDLSPRVAALLETGLVTRAMDFRIDQSRHAVAIRPVDNGYLFEETRFDCESPYIVSFLPSVLTPLEPDMNAKADITVEFPDVTSDDLKTTIVKIIEANPEDLDLEEADIIVSGGMGVGRGDAFNIIHDLARVIGGSVGGTRPIIDWQVLPFEQQIGQTGKTVSPHLILACGISGANEFTAGMEKSKLVVAINTDPHARIFRFADLGIIGDVHKVLPLLVSRIKEM
jgi:electron transfer flavoprotein alpha subunit